MVSKDLERYFRNWYEDVWVPWIPSKSFWHFYRFQKFDGTWYQLKDNVRSSNQLKKILLKRKWAPRHVYYSVLQWLHPQKVRSKKERKYCLGGPLVFDLDILAEISGNSLEKSKADLVKFVNFLEYEFDFACFSVVFSGRRGFHVYVFDFNPSKFSNLSNDHYREQIEKDARKKIVEIVRAKGYDIDVNVSSDTRRIIRLPSTLHGETALKCTSIGSNTRDIERFEIRSCIAFPTIEDVHVRFLKRVSRFCFIDEYFGPYQKKLETALPKHLALYLTSSGISEII